MSTTTFGKGTSESEENGVVEITLDYGTVYKAMMNESIIPVVANFLVFYDFDQTIATHHIWEESDGCEIAEFQNLFTKDELEVFLGGKERVEKLRAHFIKLTQMGAKLFVVSFGDRLVNSFVLEQFGMRQYFEDVYRGRKPSYVKAIMDMFKSSFNQAVFIDDDIRNVKQVGRFCQSMNIPARKGVTDDDLKTIEFLVQLGLGLTDDPVENAAVEQKTEEKPKEKTEESSEKMKASGEDNAKEAGNDVPGVQDPEFWEKKEASKGVNPMKMQSGTYM